MRETQEMPKMLRLGSTKTLKQSFVRVAAELRTAVMQGGSTITSISAIDLNRSTRFFNVRKKIIQRGALAECASLLERAAVARIGGAHLTVRSASTSKTQLDELIYRIC